MPRKQDEYEAKRAALRSAAARTLDASPADTPCWPLVATQAGLSSNAVRYYFGTTDNLLWSVVEHHLKSLLDRLGEDAPDTMDGRERIGALARSYCAAIEAFGPEHRLAMSCQIRLRPGRSGDLRVMQCWVLHVFEEAFAALLPQAERWRATVLALSLLSLLNGHALWFQHGKPLDRTEFAEMAARMVLSEADLMG